MANACSLNRVIDTVYTDEEAELHAKEAGVDPRPKETKAEIDERGAFIRQPNAFIKPFGDGPDDNHAEAHRYAIYWAHGCHWSNRPVIVRDILGLQDVIGDVATTASGVANIYGHGFADQPGHKDPICGAYFLSQFYKNADPDFTGRATTPTFVDIREKKAVNNDYHRLTNYIEVQFRKFQPVDAPDLYPVKYRKEIDEFNDWLFPTVNNGHYRMAFCQSWEAYDEAYNDFFDSVEKLDERLKTNRFLFGDYITDSDIRLYVTLVRWETSYYHNVGPMKNVSQNMKTCGDMSRNCSVFRYLGSIPSLNFRRMIPRGFLQAIRNGSQHRFLMIPSGKQMEREKRFLQILSTYSRSIRKGKV